MARNGIRAFFRGSSRRFRLFTVTACLAWTCNAPAAFAQNAPVFPVPESPAFERLPELDSFSAIAPPAESQTPPSAEAFLPKPSVAKPAGAEAVPSEPTKSEKELTVQPLGCWYQPKYWLGPTWTGSIELGMNGSAGNSDAFSMRAGANLKRETPAWTTALEISHARTTANSVATQNNALGKIKIDRNFGDLPWTAFGVGTAEYDEFKAFDLRLGLHAGLGYKVIKTDTTSLLARLGSGVSHEIGGPDDSYVPEALLGMEFEHKISAKQKLCLKADYFPEWGDFANYRMVTDANWECLLDEASNLSLKIGAIDRYDSTPNGREANDLDYTVLLLWKL
jgi:putative salt-induced outer membrane protein YdiY